MIADPVTCFQEFISEELLILLWDRPCLESIIASSHFQALLFLQDKLLESVSKLLFQQEVLRIIGPALSGMNSEIISARTVESFFFKGAQTMKCKL